MRECVSFQSPFNKISYSIIGDDLAPHYFKINPKDGKITIKSDIKNDIVTDYQVQCKMFNLTLTALSH